MNHQQHLAQRMQKRGWSTDEIYQLQYKLQHAKPSKYSKLVHWMMFFLVVAANFFATGLITPTVLLLPNPGLYAILLTMGFSFGFIFTVVLGDISHMFSVYQHFAMWALIPVLAVINTFLITTFVDDMFSNIYGEQRNPLTMGIIYAVAFMLPYALYELIKNTAKKT